MAERFDFRDGQLHGSRSFATKCDSSGRSDRCVATPFFLSPFGTIAAGERGVHLRFTAVTGKVFGEGLYFRVPLIESVQMMDVKIQKYEMKSDAASKDLQTVHSVKSHS